MNAFAGLTAEERQDARDRLLAHLTGLSITLSGAGDDKAGAILDQAKEEIESLRLVCEGAFKVGARVTYRNVELTVALETIVAAWDRAPRLIDTFHHTELSKMIAAAKAILQPVTER